LNDPAIVRTDRRLFKRFRSTTRVLITTSNKRKYCQCMNLSAQGVCVKTEDMNLTIGQVVDITFIINLGDVKKLHKRQATVKHVSNGTTGFRMELAGV
jgi:PilZ domain